jgi:hypothetical protein
MGIHRKPIHRKVIRRRGDYPQANSLQTNSPKDDSPPEGKKYEFSSISYGFYMFFMIYVEALKRW